MGTQSSTHPSPLNRVLLWVAIALLPAVAASAQSISATSVPLILPSAIVFDATGNLYIAETGNHVVRKVDPQGHIYTLAGTAAQGFSGDSGVANEAQLDSPQGLALAGNTLYIADTHNHRIRAVDLTSNIISTVAGTGIPGFTGDGAVATKVRMNLPTAVSVDASGNLYFADTANHRIRKMDVTTGIVTTVAGNGTQGFSGDSGSALSAEIDSPSGLAVDATGNVYLADTHNHRIRKIDSRTGIISTVAGDGSTQLALPQGLTLDAAGSLYLADTANHRIWRVDGTTGALTGIAGTGTQGYSGDSGPATTAMLDSPRAVSFGNSDALAVSDTHNQRIRQINPQSIDTIAGLGNSTPGILTLSAPAVLSYGTGQVNATITASGLATGSVTFRDTYFSTTTTLASVPVANNAATIATVSLPAGTHIIVATYSGDMTHASAQSSALNLTITRAPTRTALALSSTTTQPITVSAQVLSATSGSPTGTVTVLQGGTSISSAALNSSGTGNAVLPVLGAGTYTLTGTYSGDNNFQASVSLPITLTLDPTTTPAVDFTLAATSPTTQTISAGSPATYAFTTQTLGALSSAILLSASGLPPGATATFSPTYLPPGAPRTRSPLW